jgi:hypothetical protein
MLSERKASPAPQGDPLLRLYWNRAGVKRELTTLRRERFDLLDRLKEQESAISRAQEQLQGLERLLIDPAAAANAMVYFQLRHLWRVAAMKVQQFGRELGAQRERRERARLHADVLAKRGRRLAAVRERLQELLQRRKEVIDERKSLEQRLDGMNAVVRLFAGPRVRRRVAAARENQQVLDGRLEELNELVEKIQGEPLPEPDGLSLDSKRLINVAIIALSQHLVVHFAEHDLGSLAKTCAERPVADMKFGDRRTCDRMVELIRERVAELNADRKLADAVKRRTDHLISRVNYAHETDSVPRVESVAEIHRNLDPVVVDTGGPARRIEDVPLHTNVLSAEYWDLYACLR